MTAPPIRLADPVGPADAPLLLLGPSLGTSTILWDRVIPDLSERFRVVAWDLPGHGAAAPASAPFTVGEIADTLAEAIPGPVLSAGISLGGAVGLELLLRHPEKVVKAAILCSAARIGAAEAWRERAAQVRRQGTSSLIAPSAQRWFAPGTTAADPVLTGRLLHALQDADDESYALCCEALAAFDVRARLGEIRVPVLAVWGHHDAVTPETSAREIADGVQNGRALGLGEAAHLPAVDDPAATARTLIDFFEES